jgi:hypothetical protein
MGMTFDQAMAEVEKGRKVRKAGWPASGYLKKGEHGGLVNDAGKQYTPTDVDKNMTDWGFSEVPDSGKKESPASATADAAEDEAKEDKPHLAQQRKRA